MWMKDKMFGLKGTVFPEEFRKARDSIRIVKPKYYIPICEFNNNNRPDMKKYLSNRINNFSARFPDEGLESKEEKYKVKFEVFYGVNEGMPGCPITESEIFEMELCGDDGPYLKVAQYLTDSGLFPTDSGYLSARILSLSDSKKAMKDNKIVKISALELMVARNILGKKKEKLE